MSKILERELKTLERDREHLEREHPGKFVLIHEDEVIGTYDDFGKAADEGLRRFGHEPFLIRQIGSEQMQIPAAVIHGLTSVNP